MAGIPGHADPQKRVLSANVGDLRLVCAYVPNGQSLDSDKFRYKLDWLTSFEPWMDAELKKHPRLAVLGDFNIAPEDRDVHDPKAWEGQVLVSAPERAAFQRLLGHGLKDSFRLFEQPEKSFSWWDYRMNAFKRVWDCASITFFSRRRTRAALLFEQHSRGHTQAGTTLRPRTGGRRD